MMSKNAVILNNQPTNTPHPPPKKNPTSNNIPFWLQCISVWHVQISNLWADACGEEDELLHKMVQNLCSEDKLWNMEKNTL